MTASQLSIKSKYSIKLPQIHLKQANTQRLPLNTNQLPSNLNWSTQYQSQQVSKLDQWSNSLPTAKRKRNQTSQSILFLYKSNHKYNHVMDNATKLNQITLSQVGSVGLYMAQLDNQLAKIKKINYFAIYQNLEYCAGVYEIAFKDIINKLEEFRTILLEIYQAKLRKIQELRIMKLSQSRYKRDDKQIQNSQEGNKYKQKTTRVLATIQQAVQKFKKTSRFTSKDIQKQNKAKQKSRYQPNLNLLIQQYSQQLKPIKVMLEKIEEHRQKVLRFSLELGYDIKEQGLVWILKELSKSSNIDFLHKNASKTTNNQQYQQNQHHSQHKQSDSHHQKTTTPQTHIPKISQFPIFLTQQQINFIISKYRNDFELSKIQQQKQQKQQQQKQIIHKAYENVRKDRNRKLSMIKQKQLLAKMLMQKQQEIATGHKYLNKQTLRIMQSYQKIKSTTNQLIYQQTLRKLNRFCIQQIHSKSTNQSNRNSVPVSKQKQKDKQKLAHERIQKLMTEVKKMLADSNNLRKKQQDIKNQEQKQLADILLKIRQQIFQGRYVSQKRNPISVIGCLVGWKKAKKILQNQMNIAMPTKPITNKII